jgi:hypothetical protein
VHELLVESRAAVEIAGKSPPMERLLRSFKTELLPSAAYLSAKEAHRDISHYPMHRYN